MTEQEAKRIIETYSNMILRLSYTYLKSTDDAQDICQSVFLKYMSHAKMFQSAEHERAWMIRTTINCCKDVLKSAHRRKVVSLEEVTQVESVTCDEEASQVLEAVMHLPEKYRVAIYLYYYEEYTSSEIASLIGKTAGAVDAYLSRGRKKLKEQLVKMGYGERRASHGTKVENEL